MSKVKQMSKQTSGLATASLVLGIVSFIPSIGLILGIIGLILGIIALNNIKEKYLRGRKIAIAGIILSIIGVLSTIIIYGSLFYFGFIAKTGPFAELRSKATEQILIQNAGYLELYKKKHGKYPVSLQELTKEEYPVFPLDHFMKPLVYKISTDGQIYKLKSIGPDGIDNTADDIPLPY